MARTLDQNLWILNIRGEHVIVDCVGSLPKTKTGNPFLLPCYLLF